MNIKPQLTAFVQTIDDVATEAVDLLFDDPIDYVARLEIIILLLAVSSAEAKRLLDCIRDR